MVDRVLIMAIKSRTTFRLSYSVSTNIKAKPSKIWKLLTNAQDFPRWNSTVSSLEGPIQLGQKLKLTVPIAPGRTFKPKVTTLETDKLMVWSDGMAPMFRGCRTFTLTAKPDGSTDFEMSEVFRGIMLPMIAGSLPDFTAPFDTYAADLKKEAEGG
jgi:hypothetical protein